MSVPISAKQINDFLNKSLTKVFETMAQSKCKLHSHESHSGEETLSPKVEENEDGSTQIFAASVGFVGDITGVCYLFLGDAFAYYISGRITGIEKGKLTDETVRDVCGELTNMFAGTFKSALAELGFPSTLTLPSLLQGDHMSICSVATSSQTRFAFDVDGYRIYADLMLSNN